MRLLFEEILPLILYLLVIAFLMLMQLKKYRKRKQSRRYSCRIVDGEEVDKTYF
jgi:hypothetical protein